MKVLLHLLMLLYIAGCTPTPNKEKSKESARKSAEYLKAGQYEEALAQAKEAIHFDEGNYAAYNNLGVAMDQLGYPANEVESVYLKSLEIKPNYGVALISLMVLHNRNENSEKALQYADTYLKENEPQDIQLLNLLGVIYKRSKDYDKSSLYLGKALSIDSTDFSANMRLGEVYMDEVNYESALIYLNKAKRLDPKVAGVYNEIAISHYVLGNVDSALQNVSIALSMEKDPVYMINKAMYLIKLDSLNSGCKLLIQAERLGKSVGEIYGTDSEPYQLQQKYCKK